MDEYKILEIKQSVFADNDREADALRGKLREKGQLLVNLMSSPGSGKTTTLTRTIEALSPELKIAVMEADIDSDVDAAAISRLGVKAIQLHTRRGSRAWARAMRTSSSSRTSATSCARRNSTRGPR